MRNDEIFDAWAPAESPWSPWVKPVLFAAMTRDEPVGDVPECAADLAWAPDASAGTALVLDVPGASGVALGLALARRGYRPVPLYNAISGRGAERSVTSVHVEPVIAALAGAASALRAVVLPPGAPPAFLLDSRRRLRREDVDPDEIDLDNRTACFASDFPSAGTLRAHGVTAACLVRETGLAQAEDLVHAAFRWQEQGLAILVKALDAPDAPAPTTLKPPPAAKRLLERMLVAFGLRPFDPHFLGLTGG